MRTISDHAEALAAGRISARELVETCLARIADPAGEGARTFVKVDEAAARGMADAQDALRHAGRAPTRWAGIPISLKDLFDVAGQPTPAGSRVLADAAPAAAHAPVVQRMLAAGLVPVGRTNMTEFAFSGLGINPHYGTPLSPWDRAAGRIPGGSSSGAGVSVSDGMALGALGTDTGGSCRVPAAFCGVVGFKPTARRVPITGVLPLAPSLDSVGPLANSVGCCAILDALLAGGMPEPLPAVSLAGLRLAWPTNYVSAGMDETVAATFERAVARLSDAGATVVRTAFPALDEIPAVNKTGGFATAEAYAWHRPLLAAQAALYDPRIRTRIERGARQSAADYIDLLAGRARLIAAMDRATVSLDALIMPTVPVVPPRLDALAEDADYNRINLLVLRDTAMVNLLDRCAISLPCHAPGEPPVGLMLVGETMADRRLLAIAAAVEMALQSSPAVSA